MKKDKAKRLCTGARVFIILGVVLTMVYDVILWNIGFFSGSSRDIISLFLGNILFVGMMVWFAIIYDKGKKRTEKVDEGFELIYWNLSYRRKFIRTLYMIPLCVLGIIVVWASWSSLILKVGYSVSLIAVAVIQAVYTYKKWKKEEEETD